MNAPVGCMAIPMLLRTPPRLLHPDSIGARKDERVCASQRQDEVRLRNLFPPLLLLGSVSPISSPWTGED